MNLVDRRLRRPVLAAAVGGVLLSVMPLTVATAASTSGRPDTTFSGDGVYTPRLLRGAQHIGEDPRTEAVAVGGKRVWVGATQKAGRYATVQRINSNGTPASAFNRGYPLRLLLPPPLNDAARLHLSVEQITPVAGGAFVLVSSRVATMVVKVRDNGRIDRSFASSASGRAPLANTSGRSTTMQVLPDGRVLAAGGGSKLVGFRADGRRDPAVGPDGVTTVPGVTVLHQLALRSGGGVFAVGGEQIGFDVDEPTFRVKVVRLYRNGRPDVSATWGDNGVRVLTQAHVQAFAPVPPVATSTGALVVAIQEADSYHDDLRARFRKLSPTGADDVAFGPGGGRGIGPSTASTLIGGLGQTRAGKLMLALSYEFGDSRSDNLLVRLNGKTGAIDKTYGRNGAASTGGPGEVYTLGFTVDGSDRALTASRVIPTRTQNARGAPGTIRRYRA